MKYLIKVKYDGSKFYGFQRLNEEPSVQKALEDALLVINKMEVLVKGAGRTDRGVHALGQGVSFDLDIDITEDGLKKAINSLVEPYIYVTECKQVKDDFHARFDTCKKIYRYKINLGEYDPLLYDYTYEPNFKLDIDKMKQVAGLFKGVHDFRNFVAGERDNYDCIIYNIDFEIEDNILNIIFEGKSFYRYMVRNLVGAMIEVGRGKEDISKVEKMLNLEENTFLFTAPSNGLYLESVIYDEN